MTILIICKNKDPEPWVTALKKIDASLDVQIWPNEDSKTDVDFALCWKHPEGVLQDYPNLKCICSMGAGIDHLLMDPFLPTDIPVLRIVDPLLAQSMFEYLCTAAMYYFRDFDLYKYQQGKSNWRQLAPKSMAGFTIGIMGLGHLGEYSARKFLDLGFKLTGWSRTQKSIPGVTSYSGDQQLGEFLSEVNILICLLPLTDKTRGILNSENFSKLPKGACLINAARGEHLVDEDLIRALDQAQLRGACLDVFNTEPLADEHPFWHHERVLITPHCSSITDPLSVAPQIIKNYRLMKSGRPLINKVDLLLGY